MARPITEPTAAQAVDLIEWGWFDRLSHMQLQNEFDKRNIDQLSHRPGASLISLLLRDDDPAKRAAIEHNKSVLVLNLPGEIRNHIYSFVVDKDGEHHYKSWLSFYKIRRLDEPALARTCNTLRREVLTMHYKHRTLYFTETQLYSSINFVWPGRALIDQLRRWLAMIGGERLRATAAGRGFFIELQDIWFEAKNRRHV